MAVTVSEPNHARSTSEDPLYIRLLNSLRNDLRSGRYLLGSRLPSEGELSRLHAVSRHTVREALRRLREDGLVEPRKGAGTVVVQPKGQPLYVHEIASVEQLLDYAADVPLTVSSSKILRAGKALARQLGCADGEEWLLIAGPRRQLGQALPVCWTEVYLRAEYADVPHAVGKPVGPIYQWMEKGHGQVITDIEQVLTARDIPRRVATKLGVPPGSTGIEMRRTFRLADGRIGQVALNLHPAERFRYAMKLRRTRMQ